VQDYFAEIEGSVKRNDDKRALHTREYPLTFTRFTASTSMEVKSKVIEEFRIHERDTGSADVQIALLTQRINMLTEHLQKNLKDHSSRRGLLKMVSQRRRLLDYLHDIDSPRYQALTKKLKLRK
jgi:small subunit ribosomal protein S15